MASTSGVSDPSTGNVSISRLVLWRDGQVFELQALLSSTGWSITSATGINNSGQIVGFGTFNNETHGFILTPVAQ